jgi:hypothetical protein
VSRVSIRRVTVVLALAAAALALLGLASLLLSPGDPEPNTWAYVFDLDAEGTLPSWFQSGLLLACAALLGLIGRSRAPGDRFARHWKILACLFVYLSADEAASLHETGGFWISEGFGWMGSLGVYVWLIPAVALLAGLAIGLRAFLLHLPQRIRRTMIAAAVVYVAGAAGMELVEAALDRLEGTPAFGLLTVVEESLEMAGLVLFVNALLSYIADDPKAGTLEIGP